MGASLESISTGATSLLGSSEGLGLWQLAVTAAGQKPGTVFIS